MIKKIAGMKEFQKLLQNNSKVVVDYYADWCGPCQHISPHFQKLAENPNFKNV